ncbi:hypothetical protein DERF_008286 [Dermatophagoides farinae]|uniref:Uncharacterized protein n=1 Tax=Dermatophagoides farinae TaxID=6954 RepID=A0A922L905_DERFA|nr:hypothetical protein DERF_008286 [Dermatophagoides farinae]
MISLNDDDHHQSTCIKTADDTELSVWPAFPITSETLKHTYPLGYNDLRNQIGTNYVYTHPCGQQIQFESIDKVWKKKENPTNH